MSDVRIGLVTEGPTDQIVLKRLITAYFAVKRPAVILYFIDLQPDPDRMSGSSEGGWGMVYRWCLNNPPHQRSKIFLGEGLFANGLSAKQCDVILVHLDSDICQETGFLRHTRVSQGQVDSSYQRGDFIRRVIAEWLWPNLAESDYKHIEAPAVEAIESWLVAGLVDNQDIETHVDPVDLLVTFESNRSGVAKPRNPKQIRKTRTRYEVLSIAAAQNIERIVDHCLWFAQLVGRLDKILVQHP